MNESTPATTFRGLPLSPEQDSEIRHYIHVKRRCGAPWDTPELHAMLADILDPPELSDEDSPLPGETIAFEQDDTTPLHEH